ncbi:hypothetical protein JOD43_000799 [Pullulanibacillus pueri]|uniref:Membrane protein n=1 Tax=Pullulanibacillus pueri TaxID=1437324 RepID=A0A8J2ZWL4_9BACL|nr:YndM family protein [Pullulanibacillus pueri]MBM7680637.1 hypothetical protein [Pullulanibacillus pueri]GGH83869.1 membrane protein [Pullulanibacillus pueri]
MQHITLLLVKFITCLIAFALGLDLFFAATFTDILTFSLLVTVISYIVGDRIVLPRFGNTTATIIDFLITYVSVWVFGNILLNSYLQIAWGSIISAVVITIAEVFVHRYILKHNAIEEGPQARQSHYKQHVDYGTEFAEESDFKDKK